LFLITGKLCPIPFSNSWRALYILEQWVFFEINLKFENGIGQSFPVIRNKH
jgi:hypothetical protein